MRKSTQSINTPIMGRRVVNLESSDNNLDSLDNRDKEHQVHSQYIYYLVSYYHLDCRWNFCTDTTYQLSGYRSHSNKSSGWIIVNIAFWL